MQRRFWPCTNLSNFATCWGSFPFPCHTLLCHFWSSWPIIHLLLPFLHQKSSHALSLLLHLQEASPETPRIFCLLTNIISILTPWSQRIFFNMKHNLRMQLSFSHLLEIKVLYFHFTSCKLETEGPYNGLWHYLS